MDNDFGTWQAWSNQYWPAKYLIDRKGHVRYYHFGEGEYAEDRGGDPHAARRRTPPPASGLADESPHGLLHARELPRLQAPRPQRRRRGRHGRAARLHASRAACSRTSSPSAASGPSRTSGRSPARARACGCSTAPATSILVLTGKGSVRGARRRQAGAHRARRRRPALHARRARGDPRPPARAALHAGRCRPTRSRSVRVERVYAAAPDRYDRMQIRRSGRSGLQLPAISLGLWHNFGARPAARDEPRHPAARLRPRDHPLRPREQLRAAVRLGRGELRPPLPRGLPALPRRARDLDQGGLRHVARPVRRVGLAQVRAREPRPVAAADGPRVRRHLLLAPLRPRDAARGDDGRARHAPCGRARRSTPASRPTRRRRRARRRRSCAASARRS